MPKETTTPRKTVIIISAGALTNASGHMARILCALESLEISHEIASPANDDNYGDTMTQAIDIMAQAVELRNSNDIYHDVPYRRLSIDMADIDVLPLIFKEEAQHPWKDAPGRGFMSDRHNKDRHRSFQTRMSERMSAKARGWTTHTF